MFQQIDMPVSLRHAYDVYMEECVGVILTMLADICDSHLNGDPDICSEILATVLAQDRTADLQGRIPPDIQFRSSPYSRDPYLRPVKLDWLFILDGRLWKMAKLHIRHIYARIYTVNSGVQDFLGEYTSNASLVRVYGTCKLTKYSRSIRTQLREIDRNDLDGRPRGRHDDLGRLDGNHSFPWSSHDDRHRYEEPQPSRAPEQNPA